MNSSHISLLNGDDDESGVFMHQTFIQWDGCSQHSAFIQIKIKFTRAIWVIAFGIFIYLFLAPYPFLSYKFRSTRKHGTYFGSHPVNWNKLYSIESYISLLTPLTFYFGLSSRLYQLGNFNWNRICQYFIGSFVWISMDFYFNCNESRMAWNLAFGLFLFISIFYFPFFFLISIYFYFNFNFNWCSIQTEMNGIVDIILAFCLHLT